MSSLEAEPVGTVISQRVGACSYTVSVVADHDSEFAADILVQWSPQSS